MKEECKASPVFLPLLSAIFLGLTRLIFSFDMLVFVAFIPLFYYFENIYKLNLKKKTIFLHGILFSTVFLLISIHWISLVTVPGVIGILILFGTIFGGIFLLVNYIYKHSVSSFVPNDNTHFTLYKYINNLPFMGFILLWLIFEFLTNFTEFSFPWFNIAYGLKNSLSFLQILEIGGLPLLSFMILCINYLLFLAITRKRKYFIIAFSILFIWFLIGNLRMRYVQANSIETDLNISLIQGNIAQDIKWEDDMLDMTYIIYRELTLEAVAQDKPDLIVFPESALPVYLFLGGEYYTKLMQLVFETDTPIFTGFAHAEMGEKHKGQTEPYLYYNAANLFSPEYFEAENYYKNVLVPFGERIPFLAQFPILWQLDFGQANFERGESAVIYTVNEKTFASLICFEIAFPLYLKKVYRAYKPDFWVNITNDAWFYRSIGTHQHAVMAAYRAIETRTSVFRAANTGYSFYTTPDGKIHEMTNLFDRIFITGKLFTYKGLTTFLQIGYLLPYLFLSLFTLQILSILFSLSEKK